tara:strand:+ start:1836 stop:2033 length:198 start_codon:yes stop_codon:yes gene_type:complete
MAVQKGDYNKIKYINLLMEEIHHMSDDIYESLMDENNVVLLDTIKQLRSLLSEVEKNHINDQQTH